MASCPGVALGTAVVQAMTQSQYASQSYNVPAELLEAWYTKKVMTAGALPGAVSSSSWAQMCAHTQRT